MIYLWNMPKNYKNRDIGEYNRDISPDRFLLLEGRKLTYEEFNSTPEIHFEIPKDRVLKFDCLPNNASAPLVNERVKAILETIVPDEVQFFKAKLICKNGILDSYYFLNITHTIIGINHQKSVYNKIKVNSHEFISGFDYLTYIQGCMKEYQLARDEEYKSHLLVSEKIKKLFDHEKITGVWLARSEDYYQGPLTAEDLINDSLNND